MNFRLSIVGLMTAGAASLLAFAALADPPGRVGRIAYLDGEVSFQPPQSDFWTDATLNFPVAAGEAFWTGDDGRVALQIGALEATLDSETELDVTALAYGEMRLGLSQGSLNLHVHRVAPGAMAVATPAGDVQIDREGFYRIDVGAPQEDGSYPPVAVTVFAGVAEAPGPSGYTPVSAGETVTLYAGAEPEAGPAQDSAIDDWARVHATFERDAYLRGRAAGLPEAMTGARDLGGYGDFVSTPDYGTVWFPRDTPADWAPYRYGHWSYVAPWGYTWIDEEPWGFAPFHYGRWAQIDGRWGWIPGQPTPEPVYAPALVAFIGGAGWSIGVGPEGVGALGWVPLGPDEIYRPPYEVSEAYLRRVNVANVSTTTINNITVERNVTVNTYRNAPAATVVRADAFSRGVSARKAIVPVSAEAMARAPAAKPAIAAPPTPEARAGAAHEPGAATGVRSAAPPPAKLRAVRAAVAAPAPAAGKPPVIAGAVIAPRQPRAPGAPKAMIAPAQIKHPAAQGHEAAAAPTPAPGETAPASPAPVRRHKAPAAVEPSAAPVPKSATPRAPREPRARPRPDQTAPAAEPSAPSAPETATPKAPREPKAQQRATDQTAPAANTPPAPEPSAPTAPDSAQAKAARDAKAKQRAADAAKKRAADQPAAQTPPPQP